MNLRLQKFLSYFSDILIEKTKSDLHTDLSVYLSNGKYMLNSAECNYSYGSLHFAFQRQFSKLHVENFSIEDALILGFGAGSIASILHEEYSLNCHIMGVEKDHKILELGYKYFNVQRFTNTEIIEDDATHFLENNSKDYDFIVADIYIGNDVPALCETEYFLSLLFKALSINGLIIFNKFYYDKKTKESADRLVICFNKVFPKVKVDKNNGYMIVAAKS